MVCLGGHTVNRSKEDRPTFNTVIVRYEAANAAETRKTDYSFRLLSKNLVLIAQEN